MCWICCLQIVFFLVCYIVCFVYSRCNYHDFCSICQQLWHHNIFYGVLFYGELLCQGSYYFHLLLFCNWRNIPRKNCKSRVYAHCELSPTCVSGGFVRRLVFKFSPEVRQPLFLQACPLRHYCIGLLSPQLYFFS